MKTKTLSLLKEIKEVCEKEKIEFFLSGELALHAYRQDFAEDSFNDAAIMIFSKDAGRMIQKLTEKNERIVESLETNKKFPGYYLRYMDPETTSINLMDDTFNYNTNSMGVDIELICTPVNKGFKNKVLNLLKKGWVRKYKAEYLRKDEKRKKSIKVTVLDLFLKFAGTSGFIRKLSRMWAGERAGKKVEVALNKGIIATFKLELFQKKEYVSLEGESFPIVADLKQFIAGIYPGKIKLKPKNDEIFDENVPWRQYKAVLEQEGISLRTIQKRQKKYGKWKKERYMPVRKKRAYYYNLLFCSEDRMKYYKQYSGEKKNQILKLYQEEQYDRLAEILKDYLEKIKEYSKKGIGFCFDRDLFEIAICLLIQEAWQETETIDEYDAKCKSLLRIIQKTPVQHFDSVKNIFWGEREEKRILQEIKNTVYNQAIQLYNEYRTKV